MRSSRSGHPLNKINRLADDTFDTGVSFVRRALRWARRNLLRIALWGFGTFLILAGLFLIWASTLQIPDLSSLQNRRISQSVKIYDRTGTVLLYDLSQDAQRTVVPLSAISPNIQDATLAIEDPNFYHHGGIEITGILRAAFTDILVWLHLRSGPVQGGSTLTQQVVKNTILTDERTITRKVEEWILAVKLERVMTKDQILELYLNQAPYGGRIYGVEEASMTFFGVHASDVTVPEAAYLAAMLPAPSYLSPYGSHLADLEARKNLVLEKMYEHGYITQDELTQYENTKVTFLPPQDTAIVAPHFVFYVEQYLENKYGPTALEQGGWKVITTLDADLQAKAEEIVQKNAPYNEANYNASNMAMTAIDPKTGQILVMVGSKNYFATDIPGAYNVVTSLPGRQPGSTFKPFVYAQAFSEGYTPDTVLFDLPTQFSTACAPSDNHNTALPCYAPVNYDGQYRGPMTLRDALAQSINIPAVKLFYLVGLDNVLKLVKSLGITTLGDPSQYGLTLVLGGGDVTPLEMTSAYGAFADNGVHYAPYAVLKVEDSQGNVIEDNTQPTGTQVMSPLVAEEINDVLSDPVARAPLGEGSIFNFPNQDVAVKTGTTNDTRDAWTIGYTPDIVTGIWAGNNDDTPMTKKVSGFIVGPTWAEFMQYALSKYPNDPFPRGTYPPPATPALGGEWQLPGSDGSIHSILYWLDKSDPTGPPPQNPASDPQFAYWEYPIEQWAAQHGFTHLAPGSVPVMQTPQQGQYSPTGGAVLPAAQ